MRSNGIKGITRKDVAVHIVTVSMVHYKMISEQLSNC